LRHDHVVDVWVPGAYLRASMPRTQGVLDLLARVGHPAPRLILDLGCGPGNNTELIAQRWPEALVIGLDNSPSMIAAARQRERPGHLEFRQADLREWQPDAPADIVLMNAVLQWIPGHMALLPRFAAMLASGGVLGIQMPGGGHLSLVDIAHRLAGEPRWRGKLSQAYTEDDLLDPADYIAAFGDAGLRAEAWETRYIYPISGTGNLVEYASGAVLRPALALLAPDDADRFVADFAERITQAFPPRLIGGELVELLTVRRVFVVGRRVLPARAPGLTCSLE
jgi:trans-aconitate 2-methyltransferase